MIPVKTGPVTPVATGVGGSTLRRWAKGAGVAVQPCGKYLTAELEALVSRGGAPAPAPSPVADLARARAQRVAASLRGGGACESGRTLRLVPRGQRVTRGGPRRGTITGGG